MRRSPLILLIALAVPSFAQDGNDGLAAVDVETSELGWREPAGPVAAPMSLTASDGTGLRLRTVDAQTVIQGPLAYTELHLAFENTEDRVREGRFEITLPSGAAISRFAMKIDGQWQEGEVVERQHARRVYEDFLHQRQDPALLEHDAGNQFRARVFPIGAKANKELVISWSQEIADPDAGFTLPLAGLASLETLDVTVHVEALGAGRVTHTMRRQGSAPEGDLVVPLTGGPRQLGLRSADLAVARISPQFDTTSAPVNGLSVLVDTSASRVFAFDQQVEQLLDTVAALVSDHGDFPLRVVAFDQTTEIVFEGRAAQLSHARLAGLRDREALGASDLGRALRTVGPHERVVLFTDGVATAGPVTTATVAEIAAGLSSRGVTRIDAVAGGGLEDQAMLTALVRALPVDGVVLDGGQTAEHLAHRLGLATASLAVDVPGATWFWPQNAEGLQPGDDLLVYAELPASRALRVSVDGADVGDIATNDGTGPLLEREWVQARMERLAHLRDAATDEDERLAMDARITQLSIEHRVLTDSTALLVLESEGDYQRFGLDRRALANVITIDQGRLVVGSRVGRTPPPVTWTVPTPTVRPDEWQRSDNDVPMDFEADASGGESMAQVAVIRDSVSQSRGRREDGRVGSAAPSRAPGPRPAPATGRMMEERLTVVPQADNNEIAHAPPPPPPRVDAHSGRFAAVTALIERGDTAGAVREARAWRAVAPDDVLALVALGEALEAAGDLERAARAYGSIIDLFPSRADMRRMAGERLEHIGNPARRLAIDTYEKARDQRPDHPSGHRQLAWALVKAGEFEAAFDAIEAGVSRSYPNGRFAGVDRVMREDVGLIAAAWMAHEPRADDQIRRRVGQLGAAVATERSTRFVLTWETDANDVDLHVYDSKDGHAWYSSKHMPSGGDLYADVTTGFGPECFAVSGTTRGPYRLQAHYYSQGPMGYGMGTLQVIAHDGRGGFSFDERPFVIQQDDAWIELGTWDPNAAR